jgi:hypothetical protein
VQKHVGWWKNNHLNFLFRPRTSFVFNIIEWPRKELVFPDESRSPYVRTQCNEAKFRNFVGSPLKEILFQSTRVFSALQSRFGLLFPSTIAHSATSPLLLGASRVEEEKNITSYPSFPMTMF